MTCGRFRRMPRMNRDHVGRRVAWSVGAVFLRWLGGQKEIPFDISWEEGYIIPVSGDGGMPGGIYE